MARKKAKQGQEASYADYRYEEKRKNIPPTDMPVQDEWVQ